MIDDPFDVFYCAIRSRYLSLTDLPHCRFWHLIPDEMREVLTEVVASGELLRHNSKRLASVRTRMLGDPRLRSAASKNEFVYGLLGLRFLRYREGRGGWDELLTGGFHTADSYVIETAGGIKQLDARPYLRLRRDLRDRGFTEADEGRIRSLFAPFIDLAEAVVERWGLKDARGERGGFLS